MLAVNFLDPNPWGLSIIDTFRKLLKFGLPPAKNLLSFSLPKSEIVITGSTAWPGQVVRGVCEAAREIFLAGLGWRGITTGSVCLAVPLCSRPRINDSISSVQPGSQAQNRPPVSTHPLTKTRFQSQARNNKT